MPRKPSSVFIIAATPDATTQAAGLPPSQHTAWRIPLEDGQSLKDVIEAHYAAHPFATTLFVVEDTKVDAFQVGLTLDVVDDPRLTVEDEEAGVG